MTTYNVSRAEINQIALNGTHCTNFGSTPEAEYIVVLVRMKGQLNLVGMRAKKRSDPLVIKPIGKNGDGLPGLNVKLRSGAPACTTRQFTLIKLSLVPAEEAMAEAA